MSNILYVNNLEQQVRDLTRQLAEARAREVQLVEMCAKVCEKSDRHRGGYFAQLIRDRVLA